MPAIRFSGVVTNASGAAIHLSVNGENGFTFNDTFSTSFSRTLQLSPDTYLVLLTCLTNGECEFNIQGNFQAVTPDVPDTFDEDHDGESYTLIV